MWLHALANCIMHIEIKTHKYAFIFSRRGLLKSLNDICVTKKRGTVSSNSRFPTVLSQQCSANL